MDWAASTTRRQHGRDRGTAGAIIGDSNNASTFDGTGNGLVATTTPIPAPEHVHGRGLDQDHHDQRRQDRRLRRPNTGTSSNYDRHVYMDDYGRLCFGVYPGGVRGTVASAKRYNDGQWHHVVGIARLDGMSLYVDGMRVGEPHRHHRRPAYTGYWRVGGDNIGGWPTSRRATTSAARSTTSRSTRRALSAAQVDAHYWTAAGPFQCRPTPADAYGKASTPASPTSSGG